MKIHLIGSLRNFNDDIEFMRAIANAIQNNNDVIAQNWFESVKDRKDRGTAGEESLNWEEIVETNIATTIQADVLIVEGSRFNYSQGYQTAIALQHNKPVLNLYRDDLSEYKEWPDKFFVSGISHPLFTSKAYKNEKDLEKIVTKFLIDHAKKVHEIDVKLALNTPVFDKIERLSYEQGKSKTGIIKEIILRNLEDN